MSGILRDVRQAAKTLHSRPGMTASAVATIALAIGVGTSIFAIVNAILFQPLPYKDPDRLVMIWNLNERAGYTYNETRSRGASMSPAEFLDWQEADIFESMTLFSSMLLTVTNTDDPEMIHGYALSPGGFELLGVEPMLGRLPTAEEQRAGEAVVVLRHNLWQRRYNANPSVLGETLELDGRQFKIVGVMPPDFVFFIRQSELLAPIYFGERFWESRRNRGYRVMARLKPDVSLAEAQARATQFSAHMEREHAETNEGWSVQIYTLAEDTAGELRAPLAALLGAAVLVLLIMCANLANLLLVHAASRSRELAVRAALGAGRGRLVRLLVSESLLLAAFGGTLGLLIAYFVVGTFQKAAPDRFTHGKYLLQIEAIAVDPWVVAFALAAALAVGLLFGAAPAWRATRVNFNEDLKEASRGSSGGRRTGSVYGTLVAAEVAFSVVLAVGAMLLVRSFGELHAQGPGLKSDRLLTLIVAPPINEIFAELRDLGVEPQLLYEKARGRIMVAEQAIVSEIEAVPGVEKAAATSRLPMQGWFQPRPVVIEGRQADRTKDVPTALTVSVTPNYFETMGIPLIQGRPFGPQDTPDTRGVCVISDEMAQRYWPGEDAVGRRLKLGSDPRLPWVPIVGVVGSIREAGMDQAPTAAVYTSASQQPMGRLWLAAKTLGDPEAALPAIRAAIRNLDSRLPIYRVRAMSDIVRDSSWRLNYAMTLLSGLAGLALVLAAIGIYSVLSYTVRGRTREFGVRMALGAERAALRRMVLGQGLRLVVIGLVVGWVASAGLTRLLSTLLFGVRPLDPATFALTGAVLLAAGAAASYLPAVRATHVEPVEALRHE